MGPEVQSHVSDTLNRTQGDQPYGDQLSQVINANMPGAGTPGATSLSDQAGVNPYSNEYRDNTFDKFNVDLGNSLSQVSGPMATRGGTAAQGFMGQEVMSNAGLQREDLVARNRASDAQIQQGASSALHGMQSRDTSEALQGIGMGQQDWGQLVQNQNQAAGIGNQNMNAFSDLIQNYTNLGSVVHGSEENDLTGRGSQSSSSQAANISACCFIFLESYNGVLPWWVRECRDEMAPEDTRRRQGYVAMANKLVPWMRKSRAVTWLVNKFMVAPITKWGGYYKKVDGYEKCWVYKPAVTFWFKVWKTIGNLTK